MGEKITLTLDERELHGKKVKQLRGQGLVPAVVYGAGIEPISVQVADNVFGKVYRQAGSHAPVHLTIGGKKKIAMIKDVDVDPVKGTVRHASFHAVKASDPVNAEVPIHLDGQGESEAEKAGLIVLQTLEKIEVRALPMDLPDALQADIRGLKEAGEKLLLGDVTLPENVEFVEHKSGNEEEDAAHTITELVVASVWEPGALQAANEATGGDAEPDTEVEAENGSEEAAPAEEGKESKAEEKAE